jgi:hypothetical protein
VRRHGNKDAPRSPAGSHCACTRKNGCSTCEDVLLRVRVLTHAAAACLRGARQERNKAQARGGAYAGRATRRRRRRRRRAACASDACIARITRTAPGGGCGVSTVPSGSARAR